MRGRWRRFRTRLGIGAPRVAIRTQGPWYLRWLGILLAACIATALALWIYDKGRQFSGFDRGQVEDELTEVKAQLEATRRELARVRAIANAGDSRLAIERTAQARLAEQIRSLEQENASLKEDLATFDSVLSSEARKKQPLAIYRFKVEREVLPGEYRYRLLLLTPGTRPNRQFQGRLELVVRQTTADGRSVMMTFPGPKDPGSSAFKLSFRYFQRVEGTFRVDPKAKLESVQARIYEAGSSDVKTMRTLTMGSKEG